MQIPIVFIDPASGPTRLRCEGRHAARAVDRPLHRLEDAWHVAARAVLRLDEGPAPLAHPLPLGRIREHGLDGSGELVAVADAGDQAGLAVPDQLGVGAGIRPDHRQAHRHRLDEYPERTDVGEGRYDSCLLYTSDA